MPYTSAALIERALRRLGAVGDGQEAEPEDARKVREAIPGVLADLLERDIYDVADLEDIDTAAFGHLTAILASEMSDDFGLPQSDVVTLASRAQAAEQKLRALRTLPYSGAPVRAEYF